jgi:hypothetical protein
MSLSRNTTTSKRRVRELSFRVSEIHFKKAPPVCIQAHTVVFKSLDPPGEGRGGEVGEVALSRLSRFSLSLAPTLSCRRPTRARLDARSSSHPAPITW